MDKLRFVSEQDLTSQIKNVALQTISDTRDNITIHMGYPVYPPMQRGMIVRRISDKLVEVTDRTGRHRLRHLIPELWADLVLCKGIKVLLVIEVKKKQELTSQAVEQCSIYASLLEARFLAVCEAEHLILFRNLNQDRKSASRATYRSKQTTNHVKELLRNCVERADQLDPLSSSSWHKILKIIRARNIRIASAPPLHLFKLLRLRRKLKSTRE